MKFLRWLMFGPSELILPKSWLADKERMQTYTAWTELQLQQGSVVAGVEEMRRRAFWEAVAAKRQHQGAKVAQFRQSSR